MNKKNAAVNNPGFVPFLQGGGEMGQLIREKDWKVTQLGDPSGWPAVLKINVATILNAQFPMLLCWGKDYIQLYNDSFRAILGSNKHPQAFGSSAVDSITETWATVKPMFAKVMEGETIGFADFILPWYRNGVNDEGYFDFSYGPVRDEQGLVMGVLVICVETTEKIRAIEQSRISRDNLRNTVRQAPVGMCIVSGTPLMVQEANDLFLELIGKERVAFIDTPYWIVNKEAAAFYEPVTEQVMATGISYHANAQEILLVRKGKPESVFIDFVYQPIRNNKLVVDAILIVAIDVTHRIHSEQSLQRLNDELFEANEKFRMALASAGMGTWSTDLNEPWLVISPRTRIIHGFNATEKITLDQAVELIVPEDRDRVNEILRKALDNSSSFEVEYQIQPKDGSALKWLRATGKAFRGLQGQPRLSGNMMDITDQKKAEQQKDDFISIAGHELKTPVTVLKTSLQLLAGFKAGSTPDVEQRLIAQAGKSVEKMIALINELLNATRIKEGQLELNKTTFNIYQLVQNIVAWQQSGQTVVINGDKSIIVLADEHRIEQVLENLLGNAAKYAAASPAIEVSIEQLDGQAKIVVKDNGPGIPAAKLPHLFARYYRADYSGSSYSGLGLGLYISAEIIKRHGGQIGAESQLGQGASFWFTLPLTAG